MISGNSASDMLLIVGLGNIGAQYEHTRHNVGFDIVDEFARQLNVQFRKGKFRADEATVQLAGKRVLLLKPHTLMNLSGEAVGAAARFYKISSQNIIIVCDDINLPAGKIRLRASGSDGGHNGLWNITNRMGTADYPRLRVGVNPPPPGMDMAAYVLSRPLAEERVLLADARDRAVRALETWVKDGITATMNRWNASDAPPKPKEVQSS